jgi:hypothetical protein
MTFKSQVEKIYTSIIITTFLFTFSIVAIKYLIPKTIWMVSNFPYPTEYYSLKKVLFVTVGTILLFIIFLMYYKICINRLNNTLTTYISSGYILFILVSELVITSIAFQPIIGDYAVVRQGIVAFFEGNQTFPDMGQFQLYPYNTHILLIGGFLAKLVDSVDLAVKALPIITITCSVVLNALVVKKVTNFKGAHISIVMAVFNILIYWQAPVFYTHTLVVVFLPATLYAYLCLKTANTKSKRIFWWIALGFFAACTYIIRPTALSVVLAILIDNIFRFRKGISLKVISSFILCIVLIYSFNSSLTISNLSTDNNIEKMPHSHWIKMGLNEETYGVWNVPDVTYPAYIKNTHDRDVYNKEIIVQRFKEYGPERYLKHLNEKIERLWVSSQFSAYRLGEWFEQKNSTVTNIVSNFDSKANKIFNLYSFVIKFFLIIGTLAAIILYRKTNENEGEVLRIFMISTLGVFVFLLLWETAPHYSYEAFAFMNIPASLGLFKIFTFLNRKSTNSLG